MSENVILPEAPKKVSRTTGVWILTIYALLFAGLLPLLAYFFLLFSGDIAGIGIDILLSLPITLGVIVSAIGAWNGSETARKFLLIFVTLHYVLVAFNNYWMINSGLVPIEEQARHWGRVLRGLINPAIYLWYFNRYTTKQFYN